MKLITITFSVLYMLLLLSGCAAKPNETSFSEKSETKLIGTSDPEMGSGSPQPEKVDTDDKNARIARELLTEADEVHERMSQGMTLLYTGEHQAIEGRDCFIFVLGTDHNGQFVREYLYGVCDNLIFAYDAVTDSWSPLVSHE